MDIMELGAIGELVGGIAVIATLVYLAAQVRQSNRLARNSAAQAFREANSEFVQGLYSAPEVTTLYLSGLSNREALSAEDRIRFDMILMLIFRTFESQYLEHLENVFFQSQRGLIEPEGVARSRTLLAWFHAADATRAWWHGNIYDDRSYVGSDLFTPEFRDFVAGIGGVGQGANENLATEGA